MARPLRVEYPGAFYHVTSRGNERRRIFEDDKDRERFFDYLKETHRRFELIMHAYCLMDNHFHLLVETPSANLSRAMHMINCSYTTYFNLKHKRSGHLFQGRYKAILVDKDSYAQALSRYIHLNPVRAKITASPETYSWSSYRYYVCAKKVPESLTVDFILRYFSRNKTEARKSYRAFVEEGISEKIPNPFEKVTAGLILGTHDFVEYIKGQYLDGSKNSRNLPSLRALRGERVSPEKIVDFLREEDNINPRERKKFTVYLLRRYTGETLEEISRRMSHQVSGAAVSQSCLRLERKRKRDRKLDEKISSVENRLLNVET